MQTQTRYFFQNLKKYKPLSPNVKGVPIFLINQQWTKSFTCIAVVDILIVLIIIFLKSSHHQEAQPYFILMVCMIAFFNFMYFFTQFLNPGIVYKKQYIPDDQIRNNTASSQICKQCFVIMDSNTKHCKLCEVCVFGLDHHCGWFGRCIAGYNKWFFYGFMISIFMVIIVAIATLVILLR